MGKKKTTVPPAAASVQAEGATIGALPEGNGTPSLSLVDLVTKVNAVESPWEKLDLILSNTTKIDERVPFLQEFLDVVATRPPLERDALMEKGKPVFLYKMETARQYVKEHLQPGSAAIRFTAGVTTDELLAEMVHRPGETPSTGFLVWHRDQGEQQLPAFVPQLEIAGTGTIHKPLSGALVDLGVLRLPGQVEEYGTIRNLFLLVRTFLRRYYYLDDAKQYTLDAAYVLLSWVFDRCRAVPYLRANGDPGTGKSRRIEVVGSLCYHPIFVAGNVTSAVLYRVLKLVERGTLVLDEADLSDRSELTADLLKILCCGYQVGFPVLRNERRASGAFEPEVFPVYGPKVLATRERFRDAALESRCLTYTHRLGQALPERYRLNLTPEFDAEARALRDKLVLYRFRSWHALVPGPEERIPGVDPRVSQILHPLLTVVAEIPGAHDLLVKKAQELGDLLVDERHESPEARVLRALVKMATKFDKVWTVSAIAMEINGPFPERRVMSEERIGRKMRALGFRPERGENNTAAYAYNAEQLQRQLGAYGLTSPGKPPDPPDPPETP